MITLIDNIPFHVNTAALAHSLRIKEGSPHAVHLNHLAVEAATIAKPKALYGLSFVESRGTDWVTLDGSRFISRILQVNLKDVQRVFPYVATCGVELDEWSNKFNDFLLRFFADTIKEMALQAAVKALDEHLDNQFHPGPVSSMNPGSLIDWPLEVQPQLFALLGDVEEKIGVRLNSSYLMLPTKTISGLYFPTDQRFASCQLCPRQNCPSRRAPYDEHLYSLKYAERERVNN